jgi:hypothetical protein
MMVFFINICYDVFIDNQLKRSDPDEAAPDEHQTAVDLFLSRTVINPSSGYLFCL